MSWIFPFKIDGSEVADDDDAAEGVWFGLILGVYAAVKLFAAIGHH